MLMKKCNLCGFVLVRVHRGRFGLRCLRCRSTFIHRAVGVVLSELTLPENAKVHEFSTHGAIFKYLKKQFKNLSGSEYFDGVESGTITNGVMCQNVEKVSFADEQFDLVTHTEVFEHVVNDANGFAEMFRILKPGGKMVFTVPLEGVAKTVERAKIINGKIEHMLEPEFHGDHLTNGILAFRNYGLDISDRLKLAGFKQVEIITVEDASKGIYQKRVIKCIK